MKKKEEIVNVFENVVRIDKKIIDKEGKKVEREIESDGSVR